MARPTLMHPEVSGSRRPSPERGGEGHQQATSRPDENARDLRPVVPLKRFHPKLTGGIVLGEEKNEDIRLLLWGALD